MQNKSKDLYWLAVQPTPYNQYLIENIKTSKEFNFKTYFTKKLAHDLPFEEQFYAENDKFISKNPLLNLKLFSLAFNKNNYFVIVGWNDINKLIVVFIRILFNRPFAFWTDSINPQNYNQKNILFHIKKYILNKSAAILTTGKFGVSKMLEANLISDKSKLHSFPFYVKTPLIRKEKLLKGNPVNLLILSRLIESKGIEVALNACKILKDSKVDFHLYIGGVGPLKNDFIKIVNSYKLNYEVTFLGWLNQEEVLKYRQIAHVLLHPVKYHDPYPLVVLESLAFGLPVIATNLAGSAVDRIIDGWNGFLIEPNNAKIIAEKIAYISKDIELLNKMIENSKIDSENQDVNIARKLIEDLVKVS